MKKTITVLLAALVCSLSFAQEKVAMGFASIPHDPVSLSMGGVSAVSNVAVRSIDDTKLDVNAAYAMWAPQSGVSTSNINVNVFGKIGEKIGYDVEFANLSGKAYQLYSDTGIAAGTFKPADMAIKAGVSYNILSNLSVGVNVNYLSSKLASSASYSSVAADAMVAALFGGFKIAAGVTNIGGKVKGNDGNSYGLPTAATVLGAYKVEAGEKSVVNIAAQIDYFLSAGVRAGFGAGYTFNDLVSVRAGYCYGGKSVMPSFASLGLGVKFSGFSINATYLTASKTVSNTIMAGIGYSF